MNFRINVLIDQRVLTFDMDVSFLKKIYMKTHVLEPLDQIYEMSITKDLLILTTEDPAFRNENLQEDRSTNNIDAYDWNGNHVWNIADIVGDIKTPFFGGSVSSQELLKSHWGFDASKVKKHHELFSCTAGDYLYVIDLTDKKLIQKLQTK